MTKTFDEISTFIGTAANYITKNVGEKDEPKTKLVYACRRMITRLQKNVKAYNQQVEDINIKFAAEDEKGLLVLTEKGDFRFSKQNAEKRVKELRELDQKTSEFEPYYATSLPDSLDEDVAEVFTDFVIERKAD